MKSLIYYFAQTTQELEFVINKNHNICVVPLNLEILLYCIDKNINFLKLEKIIKNNFHSKTLLSVSKLENKINYSNIKYKSITNELKSIIRFKIYNIAIIFEALKFIGKNKIMLSGWRGINQSQYNSKTNYYISDLVSALNIKSIIDIKEKKDVEETQKKIHHSYDIKFNISKLDKNKKIIFLNNTSYNFWRIIWESKKKNYQIIFPIFKKIHFIKKILFNILNVHPFLVKKKHPKQNLTYYNNNLKIIYNNYDISNILKKTIDENLFYLNNLISKADCLKQFLNKIRVSLAAINLLRGLDGCIAEILKKTSTPTVSVSHGTVAEYFNQADKIYKRNIMESVFGGDCKYTVISSKISFAAYKKFKIKSKPLKGNIIFSGLKKTKKNAKKILFAVTLKDFENFQLHGVETHYEFTNNLSILSELAKKKGLQFIVNLHPSQHSQIGKLKKIYPQLNLTN